MSYSEIYITGASRAVGIYKYRNVVRSDKKR
jgi:hypothetical protein